MIKHFLVVLILLFLYVGAVFATAEPHIPYFIAHYDYKISDTLPQEIQISAEPDSIYIESYATTPVYVLLKSENPAEAHFHSNISLPVGYLPLYSLGYNRTFRYRTNDNTWSVSEVSNGYPSVYVYVIDLAFSDSQKYLWKNQDYVDHPIPSDETRVVSIWYQQELYDIEVTRSFTQNPNVEEFLQQRSQYNFPYAQEAAVAIIVLVASVLIYLIIRWRRKL